MKKFLFYYAPLLLWALIIFFLSSFPGSGNMSYDAVTFIERKGAHVFEYFVFSILLARALSLSFRKEVGRLYYWTFLVSYFYAFSDELHQTFIFGRTGKFTDSLIDLFGICLGVLVYHFFSSKDSDPSSPLSKER